MDNVIEIEKAVKGLNPDEMKQFRDWFNEYDQQIWDKQLQEAGRSKTVSGMMDKAVKDFQTGNCRKI